MILPLIRNSVYDAILQISSAESAQLKKPRLAGNTVFGVAAKLSKRRIFEQIWLARMAQGSYMARLDGIDIDEELVLEIRPTEDEMSAAIDATSS